MAAKQFPFATTPPQMGGAGGQWAINQALPGLAGTGVNALGIIDNALGGLPSSSMSRLQNAYFGSASGLDPSSEFLRNRGFDLYKKDARAQQRGGIQDLATLIGAYSGNVAPTPGQEIGERVAGADRAEQSAQFGANLAFQQQMYNDQKRLLKELTG